MNVFKKLRAYLRYREAVRKADEAHEKNGERFYVMPGVKNTILIMDRYNFRKLKHKGYISHKASVTDLEKECFYATPYKNGSAKMPTSVIELKKKHIMHGMKEEYSAKQRLSQNLDGIATLTNDPLAIENIRKGVNKKR